MAKKVAQHTERERERERERANAEREFLSGHMKKDNEKTSGEQQRNV